MDAPNVRSGRKVLFVGGPEAGNVRLIPEEHEYAKGEGDYLYRIWPVAMPGDKRKMFMAYRADAHPIEMFLEMWRDYSPAAQIKRDVADGQLTYNKLRPMQ